MTAPAPEQMRALADGVADEPLETWVSKALPALRSAADQLEAVHAWNWRHKGLFLDRGLDLILTADAAPQEDRDV